MGRKRKNNGKNRRESSHPLLEVLQKVLVSDWNNNPAHTPILSGRGVGRRCGRYDVPVGLMLVQSGCRTCQHEEWHRVNLSWDFKPTQFHLPRCLCGHLFWG